MTQLAGYLDLTSLHELSRTCRQSRVNLLQFRSQLITQTLRCENECVDHARLLGDALSVSQQAWTAYGMNGIKIGRITSGKVGACARDMVGDCRRCGRTVCRVCYASSEVIAQVLMARVELCHQSTAVDCPEGKTPPALPHLHEGAIAQTHDSTSYCFGEARRVGPATPRMASQIADVQQTR